MINKKELIKMLKDSEEDKIKIIEGFTGIVKKLVEENNELKNKLGIKIAVYEDEIEEDDGEWIVITKENCEEITNQLNNQLSVEVNAENIIKGIDNIIKKGE
jgi:hypothetical protein